MSNGAGLVVQAPGVLGTDFLLESGRELMQWWNEQGPELPAPGERYRRWWQAVHDELDDALAGPGLARGEEIYARIQAYADEARRWWATGASETEPPPAYVDAEPLVDAEPIRQAASGLWALAAIVGIGALLYFGRR